MALRQPDVPRATDRAAPSSVTRRPATLGDRAFLCQVYASTRLAELAQTGWSPQQIDDFLRSQFEAQDRYYHDVFADACFEVLECNGVPAGRLYVDRRQHETAIIDIALLPEYQRQGIGSMLMRALFAEADAAQKPVRIHVEKFNPAMHWYTRLGFVSIADREVYVQMERAPKAPSLAGAG